ncbi:MAG TPA: class IV adenylate cyclase [Spirochaetota bacterium]|nr:class IV adenylate cyclase [Spirochaetota bacterium]
MLEVEIKAYCADPDALRARIKSLGGALEGPLIEEDSYFNHPSRDFAETDEAFRIRRTPEGSVVTYKGPKIGTISKTRYENEVSIGDADAFAEVLARLGFRPVRTVKKRRELYALEGAHVCLDSVEGLGDFAEIEILSEDREGAEKKLFGLAEKLGLSRFERRSYLELLLEKNAAR